jgi:hypothetical protein
LKSWYIHSSVIVPDAYRDLCLKLPLAVKLTTSLRSIRPAFMDFSPWFSNEVVPLLAPSPKLTIAREFATAFHIKPVDDTGRGHCGAIIREAFEKLYEENGERLIVCSGLTEYGHRGEGGDMPAAIRVFELDTEDKRLQWFSKYL